MVFIYSLRVDVFVRTKLIFFISRLIKCPIHKIVQDVLPFTTKSKMSPSLEGPKLCQYGHRSPPMHLPMGFRANLPAVAEDTSIFCKPTVPTLHVATNSTQQRAAEHQGFDGIHGDTNLTSSQHLFLT